MAAIAVFLGNGVAKHEHLLLRNKQRRRRPYTNVSSPGQNGNKKSAASLQPTLSDKIATPQVSKSQLYKQTVTKKSSLVRVLVCDVMATVTVVFVIR